MQPPTVIPPGGGEIVGDSPDRRVEILSDDPRLNATWSRFGPYRDGADLHIHRRHTDLFYVLEGEFTLMLGPDGDEVVLPAGTLARVPPLVVHGFRNGSDAELRYLNLHAPGRRFADYLRAMRDGREFSYDQFEPPADGGRPATEAVIGGGADVEEIGVAEVGGDALDEEPHVHRRHVESIYVIAGDLSVTAGDRELRAEPGSWVQLPPDVPHSLASIGTVRFLNLHTPSCGLGALDHYPV